MTQQITLRSLEELGQFADVIAPYEPVNNERALVPQPLNPAAALDLDALVETIRRSVDELQALSAADACARRQAEEALARYAALPDEVRQRVRTRSRAIRDAIEAEPKTRKWRLRARVGARMRWYEEVGEVER